MHWEWIVPVIALALWILSSLVKGAEEPPKQAKQGEPLPAGSRPRPQSEVDKFLEEINRMRRRQEEEQRQQDEQPRQSEPVAIPPPRPIAASVEPTTAPNFEKPSAPVQIPQGEKPRSRPVKPRRAEPRPTPLRQAGSVAAADLAAQPRPTPRPLAGKGAPAVAQLHAMLRSPQSVQAAILLHEVLGPPRCRRRR